ncbi:MAG: hypothetical protein PHS37_02780 [Candidatus Omnitrophica bacterium]|nr:hypothetical protein [Candidatus Omnitrophota bacterium]
MKKTALALVLLSFASFCCAETKTIQFRLTVSNGEAALGIPHDIYRYAVKKDRKPKDLLVARQVLLSNADIDRIAVRKAADTTTRQYPVVTIYFKPEGAAKLETLTKTNIAKSLVLVVDNTVVAAPLIAMPIKSGKVDIVTDTFANDEAAVSFAQGLGFQPVFEKE